MTKTETALQEMGLDIALLKERARSMGVEVDGIAALKTQVALLQQRVDDLREGWKAWGQRLWMILAPMAGVAIGYWLNSRR